MKKLFISMALLALPLGAFAPVTPHKDCCMPPKANCCSDTCCKASDDCCKGTEHKACAKACKGEAKPKS